MINLKDNCISKIVNSFNNFNPENPSILEQFYDPTVEFQDPVVHIHGLQNLKKYYFAAYKNVNSIYFNFHEIHKNENSYFAKWTMTLNIKKLNSAKNYDVEGFSVLKFSTQELVVYHRDYLDMGSMVYEKLPLIGRAIQIIKKQLTHGQ
jgi:hypothetical protein